MILKFKIFEKLGYNEEVSKLTDYIWKLYKQGEREIDLNEYSKKNMSIFINKLFIEDYKDKKNNARMAALYNNVYYKNTKNFKITINKISRPTIMSLEHELKHMYDFIKKGGDLFRIKDKQLLAHFGDMSVKDDYNVSIFFYIMYIIEMSEIEAYYHGDVRNFKENKKRFKNDIRKFIKYSRLQDNLNYINENNITDILSKINRKDKNDIINLYYIIKKDRKKFYNLEGFKYRFELFKEKIKEFLEDMMVLSDDYIDYSDNEMDKFYNKFIKEVEKKKKIYLKYIGRLYAYFNEN